MTYPKVCNITPNEYQERIIELSNQFGILPENQLFVYKYGIVEEVGELLGKFKRMERGDLVSLTEVKLEMGDILAHIVLIANSYGFTLEDILLMNLNKIEGRLKNDTLKGTGDNR